MAKFPSGATTRDEDQLDLPEEMGYAGGSLRVGGVAILGRPALERRGEIDVPPLETDSGQQVLEQLAGLSQERQTALILLEAGGLTDEHQLRIGVTGAEDDAGPRLRERAARTSGCFAGIRGKRDGALGGIHRAASVGRDSDSCLKTSNWISGGPH